MSASERWAPAYRAAASSAAGSSCSDSGATRGAGGLFPPATLSLAAGACARQSTAARAAASSVNPATINALRPFAGTVCMGWHWNIVAGVESGILAAESTLTPAGVLHATAAARATLLAHVGGPRDIAPAGAPALRRHRAHRSPTRPRAALSAARLRRYRAAQSRAMYAGALTGRTGAAAEGAFRQPRCGAARDPLGVVVTARALHQTAAHRRRGASACGTRTRPRRHSAHCAFHFHGDDRARTRHRDAGRLPLPAAEKRGDRLCLRALSRGLRCARYSAR